MFYLSSKAPHPPTPIPANSLLTLYPSLVVAQAAAPTGAGRVLLRVPIPQHPTPARMAGDSLSTAGVEGVCSTLPASQASSVPPSYPGWGVLVLGPLPSPPAPGLVYGAAGPASGGQQEARAVSWRVFFLIERLLLHCLFYQYGS